MHFVSTTFVTVCECLVDGKERKEISFGYFIQSCRCISAQSQVPRDGHMKTMNENLLSKKEKNKKKTCEISLENKH